MKAPPPPAGIIARRTMHTCYFSGWTLLIRRTRLGSTASGAEMAHILEKQTDEGYCAVPDCCCRTNILDHLRSYNLFGSFNCSVGCCRRPVTVFLHWRVMLLNWYTLLSLHLSVYALRLFKLTSSSVWGLGISTVVNTGQAPSDSGENTISVSVLGGNLEM